MDRTKVCSWGRRRVRRSVAIAAVAAVALLGTGCQTVAVVRSSSPDPSMGSVSSNGASFSPATSGDGRYTVFLSNASNLVPGDVNGVTDVFVRDNAAGTVKRYTNGSVDALSRPAISRDGSKIAYTVNLGGLSTLAVVDRAAATVSYSYAAYSSVTEYYRNPSLSSNGSRVAVEHHFSAAAYVFDLVNVGGTGMSTMSYPVTALGQTVLNGRSPAINGAGTAVAFDTINDLAPEDTNGKRDVYVWTIAPTAVDLVSATFTGAVGNGDSGYASWDGANVVFASWSANFFGETDGHQDVFVAWPIGAIGPRYRTMIRIGGNGDSSWPTASTDGRYISFVSKASDLVPDDTNGALDAFVYDTSAPSGVPEISRTSVDALGAQANAASAYPRISGDGRWVTFQTDATNLASDDTNGALDVFTSFAQRVRVTPRSSPTLVKAGATTTITIKGSGFKAPMTLSSDLATFTNITVVDETTITARMYVLSASPGFTITVGMTGNPITTSAGSSDDCTKCFAGANLP